MSLREKGADKVANTGWIIVDHAMEEGEHFKGNTREQVEAFFKKTLAEGKRYPDPKRGGRMLIAHEKTRALVVLAGKDTGGTFFTIRNLEKYRLYITDWKAGCI